jgi:CheB methylesterase/CheR methyltransferase, all-alpha domain
MNDDGQASPNPEEAAGEETPKRFPTVGIGTSAGGVHALQVFFATLPDDVDAAFVVIVHLDPEHQSELSNILAARTSMPVAQVSGRVRLEPRRVYVIPPNRQLLVTDQHLALAEFDEPRWQRAPIDLFFRSLAAQGGDDFAIVLSGAGSDGSVGIKTVKEAGGIILVQDPDEAEYGSMPRSAIATGHADFILPVREIAERLPELIRTRRNPPSDFLNETDGQAMQRVLSHLRIRSGHDFSNYKKSTVRRRIARRMQLQRAATMAEYLTILRENGGEAQALFADLLISVTTFFRDPTHSKNSPRWSFPACLRIKALLTRSASGCPAVRRAKRPIRSRCSCWRRRPVARPGLKFKFSLPTWTMELCPPPGTATIQSPSKPT